MTERTRAEIEARLADWLKAVEDWKNSPENGSEHWKYQMSIERGSKFARIVSRELWTGASKAQSGYSYCFIDLATGDILKSAGWKAPVKGVRGSIFDDNFSINKGLTTYGARYNK